MVSMVAVRREPGEESQCVSIVLCFFLRLVVLPIVEPVSQGGRPTNWLPADRREREHLPERTNQPNFNAHRRCRGQGL